MLGTNPIAVAAPSATTPNFVLDMSTTSVAAGKIRAAARRGEKTPPSWLSGEDGLPVTDPTAFVRGEARLQWLGGGSDGAVHKGFGLALAVEILSGVLPGAGVGPATAGRATSVDQDVGHFFLVLDVNAFRPAGQFTAAMDDLLTTLTGCPPLQTGHPVIYPGIPERVARAERVARGVPVEEATVDRLVDLARTLGIEPPVTPT
jgi:LDH2 family malate/lactate/ureidoglycolate dehydrogenase